MSDPVVSAKLRIPRSESLARERLDVLLDRLWTRRLCLVVAPAGSGKTSLLARFAAAAPTPVAWYTADSLDTSLSGVLGRLEAALRPALGGLPSGWTSVGQMARALESWGGERALLVVDDFQALEGTPAEEVLARLVEHAPRWLLLAVASRSRPALNLSRLRVSGDLVEVSFDDLRFRSWEVERLFRDFYREPLPPVELATLARKTEGWAAGLHLFHLATRGKPAEERRRMLESLDRRSRYLREYLTGEVLGRLPATQRRFLVQTCVLGRLSGPLCDRFTDGSGGDAMLADLERRQVFVQTLEEEGEYRYHEVLRAHLEVALLREVGEVALRGLHSRSAAVLEEFGALPEALHSYCRAEDWPAVSRLLGRNGERLAQGTGTWIDSLPPSVLDHDPWLLLASARRHRAEGRWEAAVSAFGRAEQGFGAADAAGLCSLERQATGAWLNLNPAPRRHPLGLLRVMVQRDPLRVVEPATLPAAVGALMAGTAALLAGDLTAAERAFEEAIAAGDSAGAVQVGARLGLLAAGLLAGDATLGTPLLDVAADAERLGQGCLARLARFCAAFRPGAVTAAEIIAARHECVLAGDTWGAALGDMAQGWAELLYDGRGPAAAAEPLERAVSWLHRAGAEVLEAWGRGLLALAAALRGEQGAAEAALAAERLAGARGTEGPKLLCYMALARADHARSRRYTVLAEAAYAATRLVPPRTPDPLAAPLWIRLFGGFQLLREDVALDLGDLKPRARALLRLLAVHGGRPVHREVIQTALWPEADAESGARNLHVAISSVRLALRSATGAGGPSRPQMLVRDGDAYRLDLALDTRIDLLELERQVAAGRRARSEGDPGEATLRFRAALDLYRGDLLPEDGPEEWVVEHRERARSEAAKTAAELAELLLDQGKHGAAAQTCLEGLWVDRFQDPLWRLLILAHERAGDRVAARRAQRDYDAMLADLELPDPAGAGAPDVLSHGMAGSVERTLSEG